MLLSMMRVKLHSATVTECDLHYENFSMPLVFWSVKRFIYGMFQVVRAL